MRNCHEWAVKARRDTKNTNRSRISLATGLDVIHFSMGGPNLRLRPIVRKPRHPLMWRATALTVWITQCAFLFRIQSIE